MGFWKNLSNNFDERIEKQHLNLSTYAINIVEEDRFIFGIEKFTTFINRIFKNYCHEADASVVIRIEREKKRLTELFNEIDVPDEIKNKFIEACIYDLKASIEKQIKSYTKGEGKKIRINNTNYEYLKSESRENLFYGENKAGSYIKAIIEEYARKPFVERENIFFKDEIQRIQYAIKNNYCLILKIGNRQYKVSAFDIKSDEYGNYNYLVGKGQLLSSDDNIEPSNYSFRLSRIKEINIRETEKSLFASELLLTQFQEDLKRYGVQFMSGQISDDIEVELTPKGMSMYNNLQHLRPHHTYKWPPYTDKSIIKNSDLGKNETVTYILKFNCTVEQAEFYFFKFGKEAKILAPDSLASKFLKMYKDSEYKYSK